MLGSAAQRFTSAMHDSDEVRRDDKDYAHKAGIRGALLPNSTATSNFLRVSESKEEPPLTTARLIIVSNPGYVRLSFDVIY